MMMHNPPHPGEIIREFCLKPLGLTVTETAKTLGISRKALSDLLNRQAGISPTMAIYLAKAFNAMPESWLKQQMQYNLWKTWQKADDVQVRRLAA